MFYVYVIQSASDTGLYIGMSGDLARAQLAPAQQAAEGNFSERVHAFEEVHHSVALVGQIGRAHV